MVVGALLRKETLTDRQAQRVETIFHKAERMNELIQTFYDLSVLEAEQIIPQREDFNLSNLLINLITENAPALEEKNLSPVSPLTSLCSAALFSMPSSKRRSFP